MSKLKSKNTLLYVTLFILVLFSIFYFVTMNKFSYAFSYNEVEVSKESQNLLINKCAQVYAENHQELFKDSDTIYVSINELVEENILPSEDGKVYEAGSNVKTINNYKVRITLKDGNYEMKILSE
ncbi:MAG: hypothetical protein ACI4XR_00790 [Bacilli bacterium]